MARFLLFLLSKDKLIIIVIFLMDETIRNWTSSNFFRIVANSMIVISSTNQKIPHRKVWEIGAVLFLLLKLSKQVSSL